MPFAERGPRRIHYERTGEGPAVVLVPGTGAGARQFGTLPRRFARHGFTCVAVSPVGATPSSPLAGPFSFEEAARDLTAVLDDCDLEAATAAGTSLGGKVALLAAAAAPQRWPKLAMLASSAWATARAQRVYRFFATVAEHLQPAQIGEAVAPFLFGETFHAERPQVVEDIVRALRPDDAARALMLAQARALPDFDGRAAFAALRQPVLCVAGSEDTLTPPAEVRATAELNPRAQLREIDDAGHSLLLESAAVFELVCAFAKD